jgi:putative flippase GtrA
VTDALKKVIRASASSVLATALDVVALVVLVEIVGMHVTVAAFLAAICGGVTNFLLNKYWAFADAQPLDVRQVSLYVVVSLVNAMFVAASLHVFAVLIGVPYLAAKAVAAALVFLVWSYPAQAKLVFPAAPDPSDSLAAD